MAKVDLKTITPKKLYGRNAPTTGDYRAGDVVLNINPSDDIYGWVCKSTGNPGVWGTLSLDGRNLASGKATLIGDGVVSRVEFNHNFGSIPKGINVTPANITAGTAEISHVSLFNQTGMIYFKNSIPDGETAEMHWIATR